MKEKPIITEVIFRKFKDGEIIALFPYLPEKKYYTCLSYMHIGQHSEADLFIIGLTKLATPEEYEALYNELTKVVGYNLKVIKRVNKTKYYKYFDAQRKLLYV